MRIDLIWIDVGLMAFSPMAAPITTIQALDIVYAGRWQFWAIMTFWCLLAWAFAGVMYWRVLRSSTANWAACARPARATRPTSRLGLSRSGPGVRMERSDAEVSGIDPRGRPHESGDDQSSHNPRRWAIC